MEWLKEAIRAWDEDGENKIGMYATHIGTYHQRIYQLLRSHSNADKLLTIMCAARKQAGWSWEKMGQKLDDEYYYEFEDDE